MFVIAATLSNHTQRIRDSVRRLDLLDGFCKYDISGKRTLKNIGGGPEEKIKELSGVLVKLRKAFLDQATISTEIAAFQILGGLEKISTQVSDAGR
jgi:hypothetical protein